jgi:membrane-associated phospholipid phosphatase
MASPSSDMSRRIAAVAVMLASVPALAAEGASDHGTLDQVCAARTQGLKDDVKCYFTAPLRWDGRDWLYFGSTVAAVGLAHQYDDNVRTHFVGSGTALPKNSGSYSNQDALPAIGVFAATFLYGTLANDHDGRSESWQMLEATGFTTATTYLLKFAAGRERPIDTSDPDQWRSGGEAFPSGHTSVAFAIGTVLAESGSDEHRWMRRILGYGMAGYTGYARMKHNAHWLSDTVAGAAIGISTAHFVMNRQNPSSGVVTWVPLDRGLMVSYSVNLH